MLVLLCATANTMATAIEAMVSLQGRRSPQNQLKKADGESCGVKMAGWQTIDILTSTLMPRWFSNATLHLLSLFTARFDAEGTGDFQASLATEPSNQICLQEDLYNVDVPA